MSENLTNQKYIVPGEWEKHTATWIAWPNDDDYFKDRMHKIEEACVLIVKNLHEGELVKILVLDVNMENKARTMLEQSSVDMTKIIFYHTDYVDIWIRYYGPIFLKNADKKKILKWKYDGYGLKFPELLIDNEVFHTLKPSLGFESIDVDFVLEGGAIDANGNGILLTTEECLLENRNQGLTKEENEKIICENYGADKMIWLKKGILNDHTDGHIDEVARFVSKNKILCAFEEDQNNLNYLITLENFKILENATDKDGQKFEVVKLPLPHMNFEDGSQAPVSYSNFYIGNNVVLVPSFNDPNDIVALNIIKDCFPNKKVAQINCEDLIYGGGGIHCITCQEPE